MLACRTVPLAFLASACGKPADPSSKSTVFDPTSAAPAATAVEVAGVNPTGPALEASYPALDRADPKSGAAWKGVSVLHGGVRFSHPSNWSIRDAGVDPGREYIVYVSPSAYSFAIYERIDGAGDSWRDIQTRYETDVATAGAKVSGKNIPVATGTNQGRAYTIERAGAAPSRSREYLVRGEHHVVLVQVVSQEPNLSRLSAELLEVLGHLEVL
jgi:hypothetical protein